MPLPDVNLTPHQPSAFLKRTAVTADNDTAANIRRKITPALLSFVGGASDVSLDVSELSESPPVSEDVSPLVSSSTTLVMTRLS